MVVLVGDSRPSVQLALLQVALFVLAGNEAAFTVANETSSWSSDLDSLDVRSDARPEWLDPVTYVRPDGTQHVWVSTEDADCSGFWSQCTEACERAGLRTCAASKSVMRR